MNNYKENKQWRELSHSDRVQAGDRFYTWNRDEPIIRDYLGKPGDYCGPWYRRITPQDNWISFEDRKPTKADGFNGRDEGNIGDIRKGVILVLHDDGTVGPFQWDALGNWSYRTGATHWMPLNFAPRSPVRVKVDGHEVVPQKDGSVKVGCQTVTAKDFDEIVRQRQEAMK